MPRAACFPLLQRAGIKQHGSAPPGFADVAAGICSRRALAPQFHKLPLSFVATHGDPFQEGLRPVFVASNDDPINRAACLFVTCRYRFIGRLDCNFFGAQSRSFSERWRRSRPASFPSTIRVRARWDIEPYGVVNAVCPKQLWRLGEPAEDLQFPALRRGLSSQFIDLLQDFFEQFSRHLTLGYLEERVALRGARPCPDLEQILAKLVRDHCATARGRGSVRMRSASLQGAHATADAPRCRRTRSKTGARTGRVGGRGREAANVGGQWHDDVIMGVLASEAALITRSLRRCPRRARDRLLRASAKAGQSRIAGSAGSTIGRSLRPRRRPLAQ